ncbi:class I SAM-dependent methyltransferase [Tahibacter caeni]|uniref:class I SAM-dependent methyltransferase n=1 Tax=Tahibacter caeni TaxID=1453545 RepID=UPI00214979EB|nr:class I SAM-dependent methyltransferase [Tahibacter caeni]
MNDTAAPVNDTAALWNGPAGQAWVDHQELLDAMLQPFEDLLVDTPAAAGAAQVLDIGCGTGKVARTIVQCLGPDGRCVGVDVSTPMIAAAVAATTDARLSFVCADAQTRAFAPASFDLLVSRFGVMFFDEPETAFANLRRAAREGALLRCVAWRGAEENPFMTTAERAAAPLLPALPPRRADAPGQFAFGAAARVRGILESAGWREVELRPVDLVCRLPESSLITYLSHLGPVGLALRGADDATRARVVATVRAAFDRFVDGDDVRFTAACWLIEARAGAPTDVRHV